MTHLSTCPLLYLTLADLENSPQENFTGLISPYDLTYSSEKVLPKKFKIFISPLFYLGLSHCNHTNQLH